jgi:hypothetical protein
MLALLDLPMYLLLVLCGVFHSAKATRSLVEPILLLFVLGGIQWWFIGAGVAWIGSKLRPVAPSQA